MVTLAAQTTALGFVIFLLSLPLVYRKVPMNIFYGVRIPAAFKSTERWYDINAYGGRLLARWSLLIIASGVAGFILPDSAYSAYFWAVFAVVLICVLAPLVQVIIWARQQPKV